MKDYYIFSSGRLRKHENTLEVEKKDGEKRSLPINDVYSIHIFGEMDFNSRVIVFLNQYGIPLHFYNYYGYYSGSYFPREKLLSGFLLVNQVKFYLDKDKRIEIAKEIVRTSISNIVSNLSHYKKQGKDVDRFIISIHDGMQRLDDSKDISFVMGIEGKIREHYYSSFDIILRNDFVFEKRTRMPPNNMLNSLISFGNSLLYSTILTEIYHTQLNPLISYLPEPRKRRFSLSLDLSEIFKPLIVDRVIFNLVNNRIIKNEDFLQELNSCYLNENGKEVFLNEYQKKLGTTV
jgi:CRISPR-associated protein Cas1